MSYIFTPKSEDQVQADNLCPEGKYPFTIMESEQVESKSDKNKGKPMVKVKLNVHGPEGFDYHVFDYVADWFMSYKFRHFFYSVGLGQDYERGQVNVKNNALQGRGGVCEISVEAGKGGFPAKNKIMDYVPAEENPIPANSPPLVPKTTAVAPTGDANALPADDDVPF